MKIDDFLKVKKVRCVKDHRDLIIGKAYEVIAVEDDDTVKIIDDNDVDWYPMSFFEPVLDSAENPLKGVELSQDFLALKPNNEQVWR
nr:hypothetical protein [Moraxella sp.]